MNLIQRPRRLRNDKILREMTRETRVSVSALIYPIFIIEGSNILEEITSMPGQFRYSIDQLPIILEKLLLSDVRSILIFGIPKEKDEIGSGAYSDHGIVQQTLRFIKEKYPMFYCITDVCLCEYTSHGHCGLIQNEYVDNDSTLPLLAKTALSHVEAGADMVAPSDMMDGRIGVIRALLDENGYVNIPIMSYAVKYASSFYGPFRDAAGSSPSFGDRKTYQMDYHNTREAIKEAQIDVIEGADILMVKPALAYLDIIQSVKQACHLPLAAYSVSGEYAMIKAAAQMGYIDEQSIVAENTVAVFRAGADILITYHAIEIAEAIKTGRIG